MSGMSPHESSKLTAKNSGKEAERFNSSMSFQFLSGFREDKGTKYMYIYSPFHPLANASGKVMEHIYVMCQSIGRKLNNNECIHHVDRDRSNNNISNLRLMDKNHHNELHAFVKSMESIEYEFNCPVCGRNFQSYKSERKTCSKECILKLRRKLEISAEELEEIVWSMPLTKAGELLGVSDVTVKKRCKKLNITTPPAGYFLRSNNKQAGKLMDSRWPSKPC